MSAVEADGLDLLSTLVQILPHPSQLMVTAFNSQCRHRDRMIYPVREHAFKLMHCLFTEEGRFADIADIADIVGVCNTAPVPSFLPRRIVAVIAQSFSRGPGPVGSGGGG